jgi:hypothetical protein
MCAACSVLVTLRRAERCAACVAAGASAARPPWEIGFAPERRGCLACTHAMGMSAPDEPALCRACKARMEKTLGLSQGDAEYGASPRLAPRARSLESIWCRS